MLSLASIPRLFHPFPTAIFDAFGVLRDGSQLCHLGVSLSIDLHLAQTFGKRCKQFPTRTRQWAPLHGSKGTHRKGTNLSSAAMRFSTEEGVEFAGGYSTLAMIGRRVVQISA